MKKLASGILLCLVFLVGLETSRVARVHAQTAEAATFQGLAAHTTCLTPVTGSYFLCVASDGIWVSNNGAAYFQVVASSGTAGVTSFNGRTGAVVPTAGDYSFSLLSGSATASQVPPAVNSLTVCNAAGTTCGSAQTGAISLSIPKTVTVAAPTATLQ